jgi:hypothetical protein
MGIATKDTSQDDKQQPEQNTVAKREKFRAYNRAYYLAHRQKRRAYSHQYQQLHRQTLNAKRRQRYRKNPTPFLTATQEWVAKNRVRRKAAGMASKTPG